MASDDRISGVGATPLYESDYHHLLDAGGYVVMARSSTSYPSLEALEAEYRGLVAAMPPSAARGGILVDLREAKGRNDPAFEAVMAKWRPRSLEGWNPLVVLVRSALGKMHVERHMRDDGWGHAQVTTDETEARRLAGQSAQKLA